MKNTLSYRFALKLADTLNRYSPKEGLEYKKVILGGEVIFINTTKTIIIFSLAMLLHVIPQTLLVLIGFNVLRRTAFGLHALSSIGCTILSMITFVFIPFLIKNLTIPFYVLIPIWMLVFSAICLYAPSDTEARPIIGANKRSALKRKSIISCGILAIVTISIPFNTIQIMVTLGAIYEAIYVLPITYKALGRGWRNYAQYE